MEVTTGREPQKRKRSARAERPSNQDMGSTAERMARSQREISISEFFAKNRHLLGFDNPKKALLTTIKEAVDNSLDACEEARILPEITIGIQAVEGKADRFRVIIEDNGPGIIKAQIPKIFGKLLYGSKFHRLKMSRGQQGIGISAAGMYGQLTTGRPVEVISKTANMRVANFVQLKIDTHSNKPTILKEKEMDWDRSHGTHVQIELEAKYQKGRQSVDDYIKQSIISNPHATFIYKTPEGETIRYEREVTEMPREAREIKPHPFGVELGVFMKMAAQTTARNVRAFLTNDFSRMSASLSDQILSIAGVSAGKNPQRLDETDINKIYEAIPKVKIMAPPSNCVVPIEEAAIVKGLQREIEADFYTSTTRSPAVYRGNPFVIEVGLAYGGKLPGDEPATMYRFANRVPLQYQQSACAVSKSVIRNDWKNYGLSQSKGSLPIGPLCIFVHMASVWVPFTSESKEAIADYPEISKEIRLALQDCGRRLNVFLSKRRRHLEAERKQSYIDKYIPHIGIALKEMLQLTEKQEDNVVGKLRTILERSRTA